MPPHLLLQQEGRRRRHRQVGLAGAGRADREHEVVLAHRLQVVLLVDAARRHQLVGRRLGGAGLVDEEPDQRRGRVLGEDAHGGLDVLRAGTKAALDQTAELLDQMLDGGDVGGIALDAHFLAARAEAHREGILDATQVLVPDAEELISGPGGQLDRGGPARFDDGFRRQHHLRASSSL